MTSKRLQQAGFTQIELMITVAIAAILGSIAVSSMRDYTRRARISEVVLATNTCKGVVTENYLLRDEAPDAGTWGCEAATGATAYAGAVQTSSDGVIRVAITNMDGLVNGQHVYLVPMLSDETSPMVTPDHLGRSVGVWLCGSDWKPVRNALPANCRADTTSYSSQTFN
ncbi:pilin [uncultured Ramlibacter sp.]|uniref:pilin n=1 Tax=uncultured Ramlibacter sp. TaxID=260755 RepID=UPI00260F7E91|nr:pilin [uncultured Ramlibacter sp.]